MKKNLLAFMCNNIQANQPVQSYTVIKRWNGNEEKWQIGKTMARGQLSYAALGTTQNSVYRLSITSLSSYRKGMGQKEREQEAEGNCKELLTKTNHASNVKFLIKKTQGTRIA